MEIVKTCPIGHICEEARDGKIYRCDWYETRQQVDHRTNQIVPGSEYNICAIRSISIGLDELKRGIRGVQAATENRLNSLIRLVESPELTNRKRINYAEETKERERPHNAEARFHALNSSADPVG